MTFLFKLTPEASTDLFDIWNYLHLQAGIVTADRIKNNLYKACNNLARFPEQGHIREDITDKPVKFWTVNKYAIIYDPKSQPVEIIRFLRWSRDISYFLN